MELGKNMSDEDTNLMLPQLAGDELLVVDGVRTEKRRYRCVRARAPMCVRAPVCTVCTVCVYVRACVRWE